MPADKEIAFVLPVEAAASGEAQTLPGFPGLWTPGEALGVSYLGMTATEAREQIKELGLPLEETKAERPADGFLDATGGMLSGATAESSSAQVAVRSESEFPGLSEEEAAARRAEAETAEEPPTGIEAVESPQGTPTEGPEG